MYRNLEIIEALGLDDLQNHISNRWPDWNIPFRLYYIQDIDRCKESKKVLLK